MVKRKYYIFDIDDNICKTETPLYMEKCINGIWTEISVNSEEYAKVRNDPQYRHVPHSYIEFRDNGVRGNQAFIQDFQDAILNKRFAPSYNKFVKCLTNGYLFALITARGHDAEVLKSAIKWFIETQLNYAELTLMYENLRVFYPHIKRFTTLINVYLNDCRFYGVSNEKYINTYCSHIVPYKTESGKIVALEKFITYLKEFNPNETIKIGFSDDDSLNISKIKDYFEQAKLKNVETYIIDTSKSGYVKTKIESVGV